MRVVTKPAGSPTLSLSRSHSPSLHPLPTVSKRPSCAAELEIHLHIAWFTELKLITVFFSQGTNYCWTGFRGVVLPISLNKTSVIRQAGWVVTEVAFFPQLRGLSQCKGFRISRKCHSATRLGSVGDVTVQRV